MAEKEKPGSASAEIGKYLDILAKDPNSRVFAPLAEAYRKAGYLDDAIETALEGLKVHPNYLGGRVALGRAYFERQQYAEAAAEMQKVIKAAPDNLMAHKVLGQIAYGQNDLAAAEKAFKMVLLLDPRDQEAQQLVASIAGRASATPIAPEPPQPVAAAADLSIEDISLESPLPEPRLPERPAQAAPTPPASPKPEPPGDLTFELPAIDFVEEELEAPPPPGQSTAGRVPGLEIGWEPEAEQALAPAPIESAAAEPPPPPAPAPLKLEVFARVPWGVKQAQPPAPATPPPPEPEEAAPAATPEESPFEFFGRSKSSGTAQPGKGERQAYAEIELERTARAPAEPAPEEGSDSPFEVFTREPRGEGPPKAAARTGRGEGASFRELEIETTAYTPEIPGVTGLAEAPAPMLEQSLPPVETAQEVELAQTGESPAEFALEEELPQIDLAQEVEPDGAASESPAVEREPEAEEEPSPQRGVFDTETLATIYIDQGFYGRALEIYERLLGQRPGDPGLLQKLEEVRALERLEQGKATAAARSVETPHAAGGGADERVRRLQSLLEAFKGGPPR